MAVPPTITAVLNGSRAADSHVRLPLTTAALVADAVAVRAVGAETVVVQARRGSGAPTLDPDVVNATARDLRRSCPGVSIGMDTACGEVDPLVRAKLVAQWTEPDFATVRVSGARHADLMDAVLGAGIDLAAAIRSPGDVQRLNHTGLVDEVSRVFVIPDGEVDGSRQIVLAGAIERALNAAAVHVPRVHGGSGEACWDVLRAALARGRDIRVGLADTLVMPDGRAAASNAALVRAARKLVEALDR